MKKPRADWEEDLDFNVDEEKFYDGIEEEEDDSMDDMDPSEGAECNGDEDDFFADETDDDGNEALNDGSLVDGESSLDGKGDDDLEEQMYAETEETDDTDDKS